MRPGLTPGVPLRGARLLSQVFMTRWTGLGLDLEFPAFSLLDIPLKEIQVWQHYSATAL